MKKRLYHCSRRKTFQALTMVFYLIFGFSSFSRGEAKGKDPSKSERTVEKKEQKKNDGSTTVTESTTVNDKNSSEKNQTEKEDQIESEEIKSNAGMMLNFNIRFGNLFQGWTSSGLGEIGNAKSNLLSGSLALMYGFDFGLILGATYSANSTKRVTTKNVPFKSIDEYKNRDQIYGLTIGYHKKNKKTNSLFALFTYFPVGSCYDSKIDNCSLQNGYQLSVGRIFNVVLKENFTMAIGPRINFIETNMTGMMRKLPKRNQRTTLQKRLFAPAISSWFMW